LLGTLAGAWVGFAVVSFDLDAAPLGMAVGATIGACHSRRCRVLYPDAEGWGIALFVFDAAWVAFLCLVQAEQARRPREERALARPTPRPRSVG
jgi:hypothetical protein